MFSNTEKKYDLKNFLNKYWCNEHLGICYPLLKEIDDTKPISEQRNYNNEYARYWIKPVLLINGKKYLLCSQWFKGFQEKFDRWVEEQNIYSNTENFAINNQRKKERCLHYDFKKNQCMCTDSGNFTQICQNVKSCVYYIENKYPIHVVPKSVIKSRKCPCCDNDMQKKFVICTYQMANKEVKNSLLTYRCNECERNYIDDTLYFNYTNNKNLEDLDVEFERIM